MKVVKIAKTTTTIAVILSLAIMAAMSALLIEKPQVPTSHASVSTTQFTNSSGTAISDFTIGNDIYVTVTDSDENTNPALAETIPASNVTVTSGIGDSEELSLIETDINVSTFRNTAGLTTASYDGSVNTNDGILEIQATGSISVTYIDPDGSSINTYQPTSSYEGGHVDDLDQDDDPDSPPACDGFNYDGFNQSWDPNDPNNAGYIPKSKSDWDMYDRDEAWTNGKSFDQDDPQGVIDPNLINADDGPAVVPSGGPIPIPPTPADILSPVVPTSGWESNHAISDASMQNDSLTCSGWNIFEFNFDVTEDIAEIDQIDLLWNGFHTLNSEEMGREEIAEWNNKNPDQQITSSDHKNDSYFVILNANPATLAWESVDENVSDLPDSNNSYSSAGDYDEYNYSNNPNFVPAHSETYDPIQEPLNSSNPSNPVLSDDINLYGSRTSNISDYFSGNTLKALVVEYDAFEGIQIVDPPEVRGSLFTDYIELQVTTADDTSTDSLENLDSGDEPFCGDGNLDAGEECDDGNTTDGDGCDSDCNLEDDGDEEPKPANIHGKVYNDENQNGTLDSGETGIADVTVTLLDNNDTALNTDNTNANGDFEFDNLDPDTYSLRETDPAGYLSSTPNEISDIIVAAGDSSYHLFGDYEEEEEEETTTTTTAPTSTPTTPAVTSLPKTGAGDNPYPLFAALALVPLIAAGYAFYNYRRK